MEAANLSKVSRLPRKRDDLSGTSRRTAAGADSWRGSPWPGALQHGGRLAVAGAFGQHLGPEPGRLGRVAPLSGQPRQVAPGEMPINPLIDAGELLGASQRQDAPPARLGAGTVAPAAADHRLAEE